jgi:putative zinc finger/helix-turn-helix YgiT family protein
MRKTSVDYSGTKGDIFLHFSVCDVCCSETIDQAQSICNRREFNLFKKKIDGIPSGAQIRQMRIAAGITQKIAGKLLGGGPTAFSKYENDDLIPDGSMATLLLLLASDPTLVAKIERLKAPRQLEINGSAQRLKTPEREISENWSETDEFEEDFAAIPATIAVGINRDFHMEGLESQKANSWIT